MTAKRYTPRGPRFVYQGDDLTDKYVVTWIETKAHRSASVYYQGWSWQYGEPLYSVAHADALLMSRGGAYKAAARLRDVFRWGVEAVVVPAVPCK